MGATLNVGTKAKSISDVLRALQTEFAELKEEFGPLEEILNLVRNNNELLNLLNGNDNSDNSDNENGSNEETNNSELNALIDQLQSEVESVVSAYNDLESAYNNLEKTYISSEKIYIMTSGSTEFGTKRYKEILRINFIPDIETDTTGTRIRLAAMPSESFFDDWDGDSSTIPGKTGEESTFGEKTIERKEFAVFQNTENDADKIALTIHFNADNETEYDVYSAADLYNIVKDSHDTTVKVSLATTNDEP